ncbi:Hypothetical_protein [Hexamita inflata]|uniref:Hypothetical_protein n=1 Tax=Hexamita inflata TaxID=28002 RepID=A0AA86P8U4_9EUKA|nr:Hypothetical protein HINF_LOCUS21583 [Hexamita inflata]
MQHCCKALWVKIFYTVIITVVFVVGLMLSFDVYMISRLFRSWYFQFPAETKEGCAQLATIKSPVFHMIIGQGFYNPTTQCFSTQNKTSEQFISFKQNLETFIFTQTFENGQYIEKQVNLKCVSQKYVMEDEANSAIYYISSICSWGGLALAVLLLACIWFCCSDWCRCCCCESRKSIEIAPGYM